MIGSDKPKKAAEVAVIKSELLCSKGSYRGTHVDQETAGRTHRSLPQEDEEKFAESDSLRAFLNAKACWKDSDLEWVLAAHLKLSVGAKYGLWSSSSAYLGG